MQRRSGSLSGTLPTFMASNLTNLLPPERRTSLRWQYVVRLGVVALVMVMGLVASAAVLLFPSYVLLTQNEATKQAEVDRLTSSLSTTEERDLSRRLTLLSANAKVLTGLAKTGSLSHTFADLLALPRPGITLTSFSYAPEVPDQKGKGGSPATVTMTGVATTRDTLRNFQMGLQNTPFVATAALPVSAYAQSSMIPFTITLSLKP